MSPTEDSYELVFSFVGDQSLREHLGDALRCAVELAVIAKKYPALLRSTFFKTSIVHLASIIEAVLHYCVANNVGDTYEHPDWKYRNIKILYEIEESNQPSRQIVGGERFKKLCKLERYIDFKVLNKLCLGSSLLDKGLYDDVEKIRVLRNKIHLFGLESVDREYRKKQVEDVAEVTVGVIEAVKRKA